MRLRRLVVVVAVVATGCSSTPPAVTPRPSPAGPAPAGTVRFGYPAEPPTLDPVSAQGGAKSTRDILRPVLPALFSLDSKLRPRADLAASWPKAADITFDPFSVRLRLREARWSDGRPIIARDVKFSFDKLRLGPTKERYRFLSDVEVTGPRGFVLKFDRPVRRWWSLFSLDDMILPAHAYTEEWRNGPTVSGGPFSFAGWTRGLTIRLQSNPAWYGTPPGLQTLDVTFVSSEEIRLLLLQRGELDAIWAVGEPNMGERAAVRGFEVSDSPRDAKAAFGMWGESWWELNLDPDKVRPALAEAISLVLQRDLSAEILEDSGQVMNGIPAKFPVAGPSDEGLPALGGPWTSGGEVAKARDVLSKAGFRNGSELKTPGGDSVEVRLAYESGSSAAAGLANMIHFQLRPLGIRVELIGVEADRLVREWLPNQQADAWLVIRNASDAPDDSVYRPASGQPGTVPGFDPASDAAATTVTQKQLTSGPVTGVDPGAWTAAQEFLQASHLVMPMARVRSFLIAAGSIQVELPTSAQSGPLSALQGWSRK